MGDPRTLDAYCARPLRTRTLGHKETFYSVNNGRFGYVMMQYKKSGKWLSRTVLLALLFGSPACYAVSVLALADPAMRRGQARIALSHWQAALAKLDAPERIQTLLQRVQTYLALGQIQNALPYLQTAQNLATQSKHLESQSQVLNLLSDVHVLSRQADRALTDAQSSVQLARQSQNKRVLAQALNYLGNAWMAKTHQASALTAYQEAIQLSESLSDHTLSSKLLINTVHAHLGLQAPDQAQAALQQAMVMTQQRPDTHGKAMDLLAIGHLASGSQKKLAYQAYHAALTFAESAQDPRLQSYAKGHLGELYLQAQRYQEAETLLRKALFQATSQQAAPELSARWHASLGRLMQLQQQYPQAIELYLTAITELESIQPALLYGYRGQSGSFRSNTGAIYLDLVQLLLQQSEQLTDPVQQQQALQGIKQVMERFKTVELKDYFQDDCVTELQNKLKVTDVDQSLEPGMAIVYPIVFPDRLVMIVSLSDQRVQRFDIAVTAQELGKTASAFRTLLVHLDNPRRIRRLGLKLYNWLIKPIESVLRQQRVDTLVIVPDDGLRTIPYAALFDGEEFLVNQYALAITPGLSLTHLSASKSTQHTLLLTGLSDAVQTFQALPHVTREIASIAAHYPDHQLLLNQSFQKKALRDQFQNQPYTAAVFATHAYLANDPKQSFLLTHDDKINLDELGQLIGATRFHDQPLNLLVLSACNTARGDERAALGLAGMAVKSGANSVLGSLWAVNDASTAQLIPSFFEPLKPPQVLSKAKALQRAQQALLASDLYRHPYHWAGFVLVGDWH